MILEPKRKYRTGGSAKSVMGKPSGNGAKKRPGHHKLSDSAKKSLPKQRNRIMVMDALSGKCRMQDA